MKGNRELLNHTYSPIFGFNSKQWWAYDEDSDEVIDPPIYVLDQIKKVDDNQDEKVKTAHYIDMQESFFQDLLNKKPDWLLDMEYRYGNDVDI